MTDTTERTPWPITDAPATLPADDVTAPPLDVPDTPTPGAHEPEPKGNIVRLALMVAAIVAIGVFAGWSWLAIIGALIVSIFLHELGHYLVAKWAGMKVTEYFIGFGPRIWSFKRGETEYGFKAIPAGAYVRIIGMSNLEEVDPADEDRTYRSKGYWKRLPVILAGPFANFAIALVLLFVVFVGFGMPKTDEWNVGSVVPGSAAEQAGLQEGDQVVSFAGEPVGSWEGFTELIQPTAGQPVDVVVIRDGAEQTLQAKLGWRLTAEAAAAIPPVREGDQIVSVNGEPVATYAELQQVLAGAPAGTVDLVFDHGGSDYSVELPVPVELPDAAYTGFLGVGRSDAVTEKLGPVDAAGQAGSQFGDIVVGSVQGIGKLFSPTGLSNYWDSLVNSTQSDPVAPTDVPVAVPVEGEAPILEASAPPPNVDRPMSIIGITQLGSQAAEQGWVDLLWLLIVVNTFLGIINLVPLPPLDGGHAAIATYEAIRGKIRGRAYRVDMAKLMPVVYAAFAFLTLFGLSAMYLDLADPIASPYGG